MKTGKVMLGLGLILGVAMLYPAGPVKAAE